MSANRTAVEDAEISRSQCWCCGTAEDPTRLVHLGNHPEVVEMLALRARAASMEGKR